MKSEVMWFVYVPIRAQFKVTNCNWTTTSSSQLIYAPSIPASLPGYSYITHSPHQAQYIHHATNYSNRNKAHFDYILSFGILFNSMSLIYYAKLQINTNATYR